MCDYPTGAFAKKYRMISQNSNAGKMDASIKGIPAQHLDMISYSVTEQMFTMKAPVSALLTESEKSMDILPPGPRAIGIYCAALCRSISDSLLNGGKSPCEAAVGDSLANARLSLSFALATVFDRFKREQSKPPTDYDLKMTPGDYPDALIDVSFGKNGSLDAANAEQYRRLKKELSQGFDFAKPLLAVKPKWKSRMGRVFCPQKNDYERKIPCCFFRAERRRKNAREALRFRPGGSRRSAWRQAFKGSCGRFFHNAEAKLKKYKSGAKGTRTA